MPEPVKARKRAHGDGDLVGYALRITANMANEATMWTSLYNLTTGSVLVRYRRDSKNDYADAIPGSATRQ
jgi:hypothetical protein